MADPIAARLRQKGVLEALSLDLATHKTKRTRKKAGRPNLTSETGADASHLEQGRLNKLTLEVRRLRGLIGREWSEVFPRAQAMLKALLVIGVFSAEMDARVKDLPRQHAGMDEVAILERLKARIGQAFATLKRNIEAH